MAFQISRNISDAQQLAITQLLSLYVQQGKVPAPAPTAEEFLNARVDGLLQELKKDYTDERSRRMAQHLGLATEQQIADAETALGIS